MAPWHHNEAAIDAAGVQVELHAVSRLVQDGASPSAAMPDELRGW